MGGYHLVQVLTFRNSPIIKASQPKHLKLVLDDMQNCKEHLKQKIKQAHKGIVASSMKLLLIASCYKKTVKSYFKKKKNVLNN